MEKKSYHIFIADDDSFLLTIYSNKFKLNGHTITTAQNGEEALRKIKEGIAPDALLLDVIMPQMDGIELLENIRKENLIQQTAIIMLTNQSQTSDIERAEKLGVDGYMIKATTIPSEVVAEVELILSNKK